MAMKTSILGYSLAGLLFAGALPALSAELSEEVRPAEPEMTAGQKAAYDRLCQYYRAFYGKTDPKTGQPEPKETPKVPIDMTDPKLWTLMQKGWIPEGKSLDQLLVKEPPGMFVKEPGGGGWSVFYFKLKDKDEKAIEGKPGDETRGAESKLYHLKDSDGDNPPDLAKTKVDGIATHDRGTESFSWFDPQDHKIPKSFKLPAGQGPGESGTGGTRTRSAGGAPATGQEPPKETPKTSFRKPSGRINIDPEGKPGKDGEPSYRWKGNELVDHDGTVVGYKVAGLDGAFFFHGGALPQDDKKLPADQRGRHPDQADHWALYSADGQKLDGNYNQLALQVRDPRTGNVTNLTTHDGTKDGHPRLDIGKAIRPMQPWQEKGAAAGKEKKEPIPVLEYGEPRGRGDSALKTFVGMDGKYYAEHKVFEMKDGQRVIDPKTKKPKYESFLEVDKTPTFKNHKPKTGPGAAPQNPAPVEGKDKPAGADPAAGATGSSGVAAASGASGPAKPDKAQDVLKQVAASFGKDKEALWKAHPLDAQAALVKALKDLKGLEPAQFQKVVQTLAGDKSLSPAHRAAVAQAIFQQYGSPGTTGTGNKIPPDAAMAVLAVTKPLFEPGQISGGQSAVRLLRALRPDASDPKQVEAYNKEVYPQVFTVMSFAVGDPKAAPAVRDAAAMYMGRMRPEWTASGQLRAAHDSLKAAADSEKSPALKARFLKYLAELDKK